ncbi:hypothetical protein M422DRAFT_194440 [Sphaerobolus stellatus SS14]|uniref:DNA/RNA polymerase n=1 Tax=Sphaerobolus stellatus (strain SS14) TaxID=990650 RepID=A0A0C9UHF1_SPHS4|nr:hypothetical protein M422DRAFT_194440 [Sphaerobolus stellatus SS14]
MNTDESSHSIRPSGRKQRGPTIARSQQFLVSTPSEPNSSTLLDSVPPLKASSGSDAGKTSNQPPYAVASTGTIVPDPAGSATSVCTVKAGTKRKSAPAKGDRIEERWKKPRYTRGFLWSAEEDPGTPSATSTLHAAALPSPPISELSNKTALATISQNPHLFKIVTPINVSRFESLLKSHPNRPYVQSVCRGLREGFWPHASIPPNSPDTFDFSDRPLTEDALTFVREQRNKEILADRFSPSFGPDLLPGMFSSPIGAVPKPNSAGLRLITDQSAGPHSLNSFIPRDAATVRYDNMHDFGKLLRKAHSKYGRAPAYLFKSDCSEAFRRIPMHVLWQIRQIVTVDGERHVDRCLVFGNRGAPNIWCSFMALVIWIAIKVKFIEDLLHYMDDAFGYEMDPVLEYYAPYDKHYPKKQVALLRLWDELNLPHNAKKQEFGSSLVIIGFHVDPACMTLSISLSAREDLVSAIAAFLDTSQSRRRPLHQWQRVLGWANWALNVFPLLRPALQSCYAKIAGKSLRNAGIFLNKAVIRDLTWFADRIKTSHGLHFFEDVEWDYSQANLIIYCDASMVGLGFYVPAKALGFASNIPPNPLIPNILFYEALTVVSAVAWAAALPKPPRRLLVYTDSLDSVEMFHSLRAKDGYNELLLLVVDLLMSNRISLRVCHVAGTYNSIADAISRGLFDLARQLAPTIQIGLFEPPRDALGEGEL